MAKILQWSRIKVLLVGYDDATARITIPLFKLFARDGVSVDVVASSLAVKRYTDTLVDIDSRFHFVAKEAVSKEWCQQFVGTRAPNLIIVCFSSPRGPGHFESMIAFDASIRGASVVAIEDVPGAALARHFNAGGGHPIDLLFGASPSSIQLLESEIPGVTTLFPTEIGGILSIPRCPYAVGSYILNDIELIRQKYGMVVCFGDHGEIAFEEQVALLKSCGDDFGVAYTLNPKKEHRHAEWDALLGATFGPRVMSFQGRISGDSLASICDLTAVGGGSMVDGAVYNGKPAVILDTPRTIEARLKGVGSSTLDVMDLGIVPSIRAGCRLWHIPTTDFERAWRLRPPYDPLGVFNSIKFRYENGGI